MGSEEGDEETKSCVRFSRMAPSMVVMWLEPIGVTIARKAMEDEVGNINADDHHGKQQTIRYSR